MVLPQEAAAELLCSFRCNNFCITSDLMQGVASATYPAVALLNHSCAPNCVLSFDQVRNDLCCS